MAQLPLEPDMGAMLLGAAEESCVDEVRPVAKPLTTLPTRRPTPRLPTPRLPTTHPPTHLPAGPPTSPPTHPPSNRPCPTRRPPLHQAPPSPLGAPLSTRCSPWPRWLGLGSP